MVLSFLRPLLPPLYLRLNQSNIWLCGLWGTISGESSGREGRAHSQTKLRQNWKPFRLSLLIFVALYLFLSKPLCVFSFTAVSSSNSFSSLLSIYSVSVTPWPSPPTRQRSLWYHYLPTLYRLKHFSMFDDGLRHSSFWWFTQASLKPFETSDYGEDNTWYAQRNVPQQTKRLFTEHFPSNWPHFSLHFVHMFLDNDHILQDKLV